MLDLKSRESLEQALDQTLPLKNEILQNVYGHPGFRKEEIVDEYLGYRKTILPLLTDVSPGLPERQAGQGVLWKGLKAHFWISITVHIPL